MERLLVLVGLLVLLCFSMGHLSSALHDLSRRHYHGAAISFVASAFLFVIAVRIFFMV